MQMFSRPDFYFSRCGTLSAATTTNDIPHAPSFMRGLRVLFITDTHIVARTTDAHLNAFMRKIWDWSPDLLFLGGDYADIAIHTTRFFHALQSVKARLGSFAVVGNNDRENWPDPSGLRALMSKAGVRLLVNESTTLDINGGELVIAGVDEYRYGAPNAGGLYPECAMPNTYRILLSHYPCAPEILPDLMLSGHTHGGQFNLLGITPYSIGFERILKRKQAPLCIAGQKNIGEMHLVVSKGIGASRIPLRIGVRPEINILNFDC